MEIQRNVQTEIMKSNHKQTIQAIPLFIVLFILAFACSDVHHQKKNNTDIGFTKSNDEMLLEKALVYLQPIAEKKISLLSEKEQKLVFLGKALFFDKNLSINRNQSCNSCHNLKTYGVDHQMFSEGTHGFLGNRNTPTVLNACEQYAQFWDARAENLASQAREPLLNEQEMGMSTPDFVIKRIKEKLKYQKDFKTCFPNSMITFENAVKAIAAFESQLTTPSRFDDFLNGNLNALTNAEKKGLNLFIDSGCIPCHGGKNIGGQLPQLFPLFGELNDYVPISNIDSSYINQDGKLLLKVPSLRNISETPPYFHNGSIKTLSDAIRIMARAQTNTILAQDEVNAIGKFLESLTGKLPEIAEQ